LGRHSGDVLVGLRGVAEPDGLRLWELRAEGSREVWIDVEKHYSVKRQQL
jgi:hypothetical protein